MWKVHSVMVSGGPAVQGDHQTKFSSSGHPSRLANNPLPGPRGQGQRSTRYHHQTPNVRPPNQTPLFCDPRMQQQWLLFGEQSSLKI